MAKVISIDVIQRSAQMLIPDLDGCYWVISVHENTHPMSPTNLTVSLAGHAYAGYRGNADFTLENAVTRVAAVVGTALGSLAGL